MKRNRKSKKMSGIRSKFYECDSWNTKGFKKLKRHRKRVLVARIIEINELAIMFVRYVSCVSGARLYYAKITNVTFSKDIKYTIDPSVVGGKG